MLGNGSQYFLLVSCISLKLLGVRPLFGVWVPYLWQKHFRITRKSQIFSIVLCVRNFKSLELDNFEIVGKGGVDKS